MLIPWSYAPIPPANPNFAELLARVRAADLAAYAHQDLPFERLVEILNPARSLSRHPLFQVMLAFQNTPEAVLELPGIVATLEPVTTDAAKFDLCFSLSERRAPDGTPDGIEGIIEYSTDLFERSSVEAIATPPGASVGGRQCRSPSADWPP